MRFFFYGTLMRPRLAPGPLAQALRDATPRGTGRVPGRLFHLGGYPGGVPDPAADTRIVGEVFDLPDSPELLQTLDAYEGFDPESPDRSLFRRCELDVALDSGGSTRCWIYAFHGETRGAPRIGGDGRDARWPSPPEPGAP